MVTRNGFTLIEIVVVVAIIGIASAIVMSAVGNGRVRKTVEGDARRLSGVLRELQNNALTGKQMSSGRISCRFALQPSVVGATSVVPRYAYRNGTTCASVLSTNLPRFSLSPGVSFSVANDGVRFIVPWGKVWNDLATAVPLVAPARYTITKAGITWSVCVYPEGRIEEVVGASCP